MSQVAFSEETVNCFVEKLSKSAVGNVYLDLEKFNKMFRMDYTELTTSSIS